MILRKKPFKTAKLKDLPLFEVKKGIELMWNVFRGSSRSSVTKQKTQKNLLRKRFTRQKPKKRVQSQKITRESWVKKSSCSFRVSLKSFKNSNYVYKNSYDWEIFKKKSSKQKNKFSTFRRRLIVKKIDQRRLKPSFWNPKTEEISSFSNNNSINTLDYFPNDFESVGSTKSNQDLDIFSINDSQNSN